jgi:hypothetical protein
MALSAPLRFDGPSGSRPTAGEASASATSDAGATRAIHLFDIIDLDSSAGRPEWRRPGFVFSARIAGRDAEGNFILDSPFGSLKARGESELPLRSIVRFRVEKDGDSVLLRLLGPASDGAARMAVSAAERGGTANALLKTLGLPADHLSSALLSFIRVFGLRVDAELVRSLRRTALRTHLDQETAALAASAAEAKGVRLRDGALDDYVAAIDVDGGRKRDGRPQDGDGSGAKSPDQRNGSNRRRLAKTDAEALRADFELAQGTGDALSLLNRLPGRDGSRWIVFPVDFLAKRGLANQDSAQEVEIRAVVRILLLAEHGTNAVRVGRWAVTVAATGRTWYFDAEAPGSSDAEVRVSADPPLGGEMTRVREALFGVFKPLGLTVRVSADIDDRRFRDRESEPYAVFEAEA